MTDAGGDEPALAPRVEGTVTLHDGRRIGFAEYGPPSGRPVLWFHGTPGARRQVPPTARTAADELGVRIVALERPGVGASSPHAYDSIVDYAPPEPMTTIDKIVDNSRMLHDLGGQPEVSFEEGLRRTIEWQRKVYGL